jgi:hypothetical protein
LGPNLVLVLATIPLFGVVYWTVPKKQYALTMIAATTTTNADKVNYNHSITPVVTETTVL